MRCAICKEAVDQHECDRVAESFNNPGGAWPVCFSCAEDRWKAEEERTFDVDGEIMMPEEMP